MRAIGATWGDPRSTSTYSGVPFHLFGELERRGTMVDRADVNIVARSDLMRGAVDLRRTWEARRPKRNAVWRYLPETIELLTRRYAAVQATQPDHDVTLQFGVAGIPSGPVVAHVEIPVSMALELPGYARSYGFDRIDQRTAERAIDGEREFLSRCDLVWTNTEWTAAAIQALGVDRSAIAVCAPPCGVGDPGPIERDWSEVRIVFIGKDWERKGGPLLVEAFTAVRRERPEATLTVIGCEPDVDGPGIEVLGFLAKDSPAEAATLDQALCRATVFAMPSHWESTGIVYMEAATYGLPIVMLRGQGREHLFAADVSVTLDDPSPAVLAQALLDLAADPAAMAAMGAAGRALVHARYRVPVVTDQIEGFLSRAIANHG